MLIGGAGVLSWWLDVPLVRSVYEGLTPTTPNSALGLLLIGIALGLGLDSGAWAARSQRTKAFALFCTTVVLMLSLVTTLEYLGNRDFGVDYLFFRQAAAPPLPLRMAPTSAVNFVVVSMALLLTLSGRAIPAAQLMGLSASFIGVLAMTGYAFQLRVLYAIGNYTPMSVQMAVMSLILGLAVLVMRSDRGIMLILVSENLGGIVARRLLPLGVGFPFLLALLSYIGNTARLGRTQFGAVILLFLGIVMFTVPILWTAVLLYRTDRKRERAEMHIYTQYRIASLLSGAGRVREIAQRVMETVCTDLKWTSGIAWEIQGDPPELRAIAQVNAVRADDASFATRAWLANKTLWEDGRAAFPVRVGGNVTGLIECFNPMFRERDDEVVRVVETIAAHIGQFVEHKRYERQVRRLNRDLQQRASELEFTNKELEAFSYSVSHDLRAPLRHISGFVQLLTKRCGSALDTESARYIAVISDSCARMGQLIDSLLSFSRMGRAEILKGPIQLDEIVRQILTELTPATAGRDIEWFVDSLPAVFGDAAMIRIVLMNYISNALKYTQRRDKVRIEIGTCSHLPTEITVFVRDNGAGFDMKYAGKLFGVFQRLHRDDEFEGTGIGLATARRIIARHGGRTWAEGILDQGATFYFTLPNLETTT